MGPVRVYFCAWGHYWTTDEDGNEVVAVFEKGVEPFADDRVMCMNHLAATGPTHAYVRAGGMGRRRYMVGKRRS